VNFHEKQKLSELLKPTRCYAVGKSREYVRMHIKRKEAGVAEAAINSVHDHPFFFR